MLKKNWKLRLHTSLSIIYVEIWTRRPQQHWAQKRFEFQKHCFLLLNQCHFQSIIFLEMGGMNHPSKRGILQEDMSLLPCGPQWPPSFWILNHRWIIDVFYLICHLIVGKVLRKGKKLRYLSIATLTLPLGFRIVDFCLIFLDFLPNRRNIIW